MQSNTVSARDLALLTNLEVLNKSNSSPTLVSLCQAYPPGFVSKIKVLYVSDEHHVSFYETYVLQPRQKKSRNSSITFQSLPSPRRTLVMEGNFWICWFYSRITKLLYQTEGTSRWRHQRNYFSQLASQVHQPLSPQAAHIPHGCSMHSNGPVFDKTNSSSHMYEWRRVCDHQPGHLTLLSGSDTLDDDNLRALTKFKNILYFVRPHIDGKTLIEVLSSYHNRIF